MTSWPCKLSLLLALNILYLGIAAGAPTKHFSSSHPEILLGFTIELPNGWKSASVGDFVSPKSSGLMVMAHIEPFLWDTAVLQGPQGENVGITCFYMGQWSKKSMHDHIEQLQNKPSLVRLHPNYYTAIKFSGWSGEMSVIPMSRRQGVWPKGMMDILIVRGMVLVYLHALFSSLPNSSSVQTIEKMIRPIEIDKIPEVNHNKG